MKAEFRIRYVADDNSYHIDYRIGRAKKWSLEAIYPIKIVDLNGPMITTAALRRVQELNYRGYSMAIMPQKGWPREAVPSDMAEEQQDKTW